MSLPSDQELIQRCLRGESGGWSALTSRYADLVYGVIWRAGLRGEDASDATQETWLRLLKSLGRLRSTDRLPGWLAMTARREAWRLLRRRRTSTQRDRDGARPESAPGPLPPEELVAVETTQRVREAFSRISARCRQLLDLLFFVSPRPSYREIAEKIGVPVGSLGPTRMRCLDALRRELEEAGFPGPAGVSGKPRPPSGATEGAEPR